MPLTDPQKFRGARAVLDWTQDELAERAGVSKATISYFEKGTRAMLHNNKMACWKAFFAAGISFNCDSIKFSPTTPAPLPEQTEETTTYDR